MRRYSSGVPFWGITVPKIEATARMIKRGIVRRTEDRESHRAERNPFSFSSATGYLIVRRSRNQKKPPPPSSRGRVRVGGMLFA